MQPFILALHLFGKIVIYSNVYNYILFVSRVQISTQNQVQLVFLENDHTYGRYTQGYDQDYLDPAISGLLDSKHDANIRRLLDV